MKNLPLVRRVLFLIFAVFIFSSGVAAQTYYSIRTVVPITVANEQTRFYTGKINNLGYATGQTIGTPADTNGLNFNAQFWVGGVQLPAGGNFSRGFVVKEGDDLVVGIGDHPDQDGSRRMFTSTTNPSLTWFECPPAFFRFCAGYAINDDGTIVGSLNDLDLHPEAAPVDSVFKALRWDSTAYTELFPGFTGLSVAYDINDNGTIVGMRGGSPFVLSVSGNLTILQGQQNTSVTVMKFAKGINKTGNMIGGHAPNAGGIAQRAFFKDGGAAIDIGHLGVTSVEGERAVDAHDINNHNQVVGTATVGFEGESGNLVRHAFVWDPVEGMRDLNTLIAPTSGVVLTNATGINDKGEIIAEGYTVGSPQNFPQRAFILRAPPTPLILIPGVAGSTLRDTADQTMVWPDGVLNFLHPSILDRLVLDGANPPVLEAVDAIDHFAGDQFYGPLVEALGQVGYVKHDIQSQPARRIPDNYPGGLCTTPANGEARPTLFVFAYDWRKSNSESAYKLKQYIECVQKFHPGTKVDILTHSMGGLVARRYLLEYNQENKVRKLVTTVAPFLGAPKAIEVLQTGKFIGPVPYLGFYLRKGTVARMAKFAEGAHELLPSEWYFDLGERPYGIKAHQLQQANLFTYSEAKTNLDSEFSTHPWATNEAFHAFPSNTRRQDNWRLDSTQISVFHIYGVQHEEKTLGRIVRRPAVEFPIRIPIVESKFWTYLTKGDGTVPEVSARRAQPNDVSLLTSPAAALVRCRSGSKETDKRYDHNGILQNPAVRSEIFAMLDGSWIGVPNCDSSSGGGTRPNGSEPESLMNELKISRIDRLDITDGNGNTNSPVSAAVDKAVPDVEYEYGSESSESGIWPHDVRFPVGKELTVEFTGVDKKIAIELSQGPSQSTSTAAIKYLDLQLPVGVRARLRFNPATQRPDDLRYDANGDGTFETVVAPTFDLSGTAANDTTEPLIEIQYTVDHSVATVTTNVTDSETGVNRIRYAIQGQLTDHPYTGPFTVNIANPRTIVVAAEDNAGNRSLLQTVLVSNSRRTSFDYDGDAKSDISVFRPSNNFWYLQQPAGGITEHHWGEAGDKIVPADYDGDGKTDVAVYRPSTGTWYIIASATQTMQVISGWGISGDQPVPSDRDGDGKADLVLYRPSNNNWYTRFATGTYDTAQFGISGDKPVLGDFDGDGRGDIAVFRPSNSNWYVLRSSVGFTITTWGETGDIPAPGDFDGDGATDLAIFRPSTGYWYTMESSAGFGTVGWGQAGDIPAPADYDGDGKVDPAVFRPSNWTWYLKRSTTGMYDQQFGQPGDEPTPHAFIY